MSVSLRIEQIETIFRQHYDHYVKIAKVITRSSDAATDAVQDAFTRLLEKNDKLIGVRNYEAYIAVSVKNAAIDIYRKNKRSIPTDPSHISVADEQDPKVKNNFELRQLLLKELESFPAPVRNAYADHVFLEMPVVLLAKSLEMKTDTLAHNFTRIKKFLVRNSSTILPLILGILAYLYILFFMG